MVGRSDGEDKQFPFWDLELGPKVAFFDERRFRNKATSLGTQRFWLDVFAVPIARPQNVPDAKGNFLYRGSAAIFVTGKVEEVAKLEKPGFEDPQTGRPNNVAASMLFR